MPGDSSSANSPDILKRSVAELVDQQKLGLPPDDWHDALRVLVATRQPDHPDGTREQQQRFLMGVAMSQLRGRVSARTVSEMLNRLLELQA